ncbi:MAG TPA: hypothetical protein VNA13_00330 [Xanthomonadales bacterium]|nr:hypothetical protein [Xanthomonadales bacterium]
MSEAEGSDPKLSLLNEAVKGSGRPPGADLGNRVVNLADGTPVIIADGGIKKIGPPSRMEKPPSAKRPTK